MFRHLAGATQSTEVHGTAASVSPRPCFTDPVISAHGRAVVLDINVGQLLSAAGSIPGELLLQCAAGLPLLCIADTIQYSSAATI